MGNKINLIRTNTFPNKVVIVDGQGRSGKNLIAVLLSSMNNVGKMRLDSQIDYIPRYWSLGKMTEDAAIVALKTEFDQKLYYDSISRDVNFRWDDYSGIFKQSNWWVYIKRLLVKPGPDILHQIINDQRIFQEMTHDGIQFFDLYIKALGKRLRFIHVLRNPIHNIYEQNRRGLGKRIGADPTELQLTFSYKNFSIPLMAKDSEELWLKGSELEKLVITVESMFRRNLSAINRFMETWGEQIFILEFEHFVQEPTRVMKMLEEFVGESFGPSSRRIMRREKCPRTISESQLSQRIRSIRETIGSEYRYILDQMLTDYEEAIIQRGL